MLISIFYFYNCQIPEFKDKSQILTEYDKWYENDTFRYVADNIFSNEKMVRTFPNLRIMLEDGTLIYTRDLYPDIQPYYFKVFDVTIKDSNK